MRTVLHTVQSSPGVVRLFDGETLRPLWSKRVGWGVRYGWLDGVNGAYVVCNFFTGRVTVLDAWTGEVRRKLWGSPRCRLPWPSRDGKDLYWATKSGVLVFERRVFR